MPSPDGWEKGQGPHGRPTVAAARWVPGWGGDIDSANISQHERSFGWEEGYFLAGEIRRFGGSMIRKFYMSYKKYKYKNGLLGGKFEGKMHKNTELFALYYRNF